MNYVNKAIGNNIRQTREVRHYSLSHLANLMVDHGYKTVTANTIACWERGERTIPADAIVAISKSLECSPYRIINYDDQYTKPDMTLYHDLMVFPEHERDIISFLSTRWLGNVHCLIEFNLMYAVLPEWFRVKVARLCMKLFIICKERETLGRGWEYVDFDKIFIGTNRLNKGQSAQDRHESSGVIK